MATSPAKDGVKLSEKNQAEVNSIEAFMARAQLAQAPAWMPGEGDFFRGQIVGFRVGTTEKYDDYPVIIYRKEDGSHIALHGFHTMVKDRMAELKPKVGDWHTVLYGGKRVTNDTKDSPVEDQTHYHVYYIESDTVEKNGDILTEMTF